MFPFNPLGPQGMAQALGGSPVQQAGYWVSGTGPGGARVESHEMNDIAGALHHLTDLQSQYPHIPLQLHGSFNDFVDRFWKSQGK